MSRNKTFVQAENVTEDNGSTTSRTTVINNCTQTDEDTGQIVGSAPLVLVCDVDNPPKAPRKKAVTQNQQAHSSEVVAHMITAPTH